MKYQFLGYLDLQFPEISQHVEVPNPMPIPNKGNIESPNMSVLNSSPTSSTDGAVNKET